MGARVHTPLPGSDFGDLHVVPDFEGEWQHKLTLCCWCRPKRDQYVPRVVVHNRMAQA